MVGQLQKVVFRTDASIQMGVGHMMRCLTLANQLKLQGVQSHFLTRPLQGNRLDSIIENGHKVTALSSPKIADSNMSQSDLYESWLGVPRDVDAQECEKLISDIAPDLVVVDSYALGADWEQRAVPAGTAILAIDDLANRPHFCDLLLNQNLGTLESDYDGLLCGETRTLTGSKWALLRPEFTAARDVALARRSKTTLGNILIAMGGMDKDNATGQILDVLLECSLPSGAEITIVLGSAAPHLAAVRKAAKSMPVQTNVLCEVKDMAPLMSSADLSIGSGGSTAWERCCLGLPTLMITIADNQLSIAIALDNAKAAVYLGDARHNAWKAALIRNMELAIDDAWRNKVSNAAAKVCDGKGVARTVNAIEKLLSEKDLRQISD